MAIEILAVIRDPKARFLRLYFQRMGQTQIAKLEMVTIRFAIGRNVNQLALARGVNESIDQPATGSQRVLERDRASEWTIVEKHR